MLTVVYTYYNQPGMLSQLEKDWEAWPEDVEIIMVDDGSKVPAIKPDRARLLRVLKDIPWHQDGARNLGASEASHDWVLFMDLDHSLSGDSMHELLRALGQLDRGYYYLLNRRRIGGQSLKPAPNIFLIDRKLFWEVGGYDERRCGSYGTDIPFRARLNEVCDPRNIGVTLQVYLPENIKDAATTGLSRVVPDFPELDEHIRVLDFEWEEVE